MVCTTGKGVGTFHVAGPLLFEVKRCYVPSVPENASLRFYQGFLQAGLPEFVSGIIIIYTIEMDSMKRFEELFDELKKKVAADDPESGTVRAIRAGKHAIGKKVLEEAGEVWMAAEYEGREKTAEEISQLLYHLQVMMIACDLELDDIYKYL